MYTFFNTHQQAGFPILWYPCLLGLKRPYLAIQVIHLGWGFRYDVRCFVSFVAFQISDSYPNEAYKKIGQVYYGTDL